MWGFTIYVSHTLHQVCACGGVFILKGKNFLIILFYFVCCYLRYLPGIGKYLLSRVLILNMWRGIIIIFMLFYKY